MQRQTRRRGLAWVAALVVSGCGSVDDSGLTETPGASAGPSTPSTTGGASTNGSDPASSGGSPASSGGATSAGGATGGSTAGTTGACATNEDCLAGVCDPAAGRCVACLLPADCGDGRDCVDNVCVGPAGSGGVAGDAGTGTGGISAGTGGVAGAGGAETGGTGGTDLPPGAWTPCTSSQQCTDDRACTATLQGLIVSGRVGACVRRCSLGNTSECDPLPPGGGELGCTSVPLVGGYCTITCGSSDSCPIGFECASGFCFHQ